MGTFAHTSYKKQVNNLYPNDKKHLIKNYTVRILAQNSQSGYRSIAPNTHACVKYGN